MKAMDVVAGRKLTGIAMPVLIRKGGSIVGWLFEMESRPMRVSTADRITAVWEKFGRDVELRVAEQDDELDPAMELKFD